ncbi:MAG: DNA-3-methyladenine glycosylase [Candidatus Aenigmatarchaeota archaeon]|nr:DNA-3-methyladenine glycosylase [Candidatus Aenigmarchaeota archaeon]
MKQINQDFFARNTLVVAKELLGKIIKVGNVSGMIVETEAYRDDPASHAYNKTLRSKLMYDTWGHVYVYFIYGNHWCLNFTTEKNKPGAVLIRALQPLSGIDLMKKRRKTENIKQLTNGPGKLTQALGITNKFNGEVIGKHIKVFDNNLKFEIIQTTRIGISVAKDLPWRFYIKGNPWVSKF